MADAAALREHLSQCSAARDQAAGAAGGQIHTTEEMLQAGYELARQSHAPAATQTATGPGTLAPKVITVVWFAQHALQWLVLFNRGDCI